MNKVNKELLVNGYVREQEKELKLSKIIPGSIYKLIFQFQLLVETWSTEYNDSRVELSDDGSIATIQGNINLGSTVTMLGDYIVKYGDSLEWKLTLQEQTKTEPNFAVGIIPNNVELLQNYTWHEDVSNKGAFLLATMPGFFGNSGHSYKFADENLFGDENDVLEMKLDWSQSKLSYNVNGKDFGDALEKCAYDMSVDETAEYRLIVIILWATDIELLVEACYS